jgi:hypothetical protein
LLAILGIIKTIIRASSIDVPGIALSLFAGLFVGVASILTTYAPARFLDFATIVGAARWALKAESSI